jgi:hypothetical protein
MHLSASTGGGREGGRGSESRRATGVGGGEGEGGVNEESVARSESRRLDIDSYRSILLDDTLERGAAGIFYFLFSLFFFSKTFRKSFPVYNCPEIVRPSLQRVYTRTFFKKKIADGVRSRRGFFS